ncbi:MAG: LPS export ABC transporter permease LptG [Gammaproteobacteria bacterium]|nr:LPS export ABC transporter permease LptG [Gammaproteobacteria bacterium]HXK55609.1 LPS export ABC transporter permease LptG [Gammaproteobacteria bacterium]
MKKLDRYIGRTVVLGIMLSLLVLLTLVAFITLLKEMEDVGRGAYQTTDALFYILLILPRGAYEIFPVAVLLGSLIGLGGLASHSELTAMRAAGISLARIIFAALKGGLLVMLLIVFIGEFVAPNSENHAEVMRAEKISKQITLKTKYGFWARDGNSYINIRYFPSSSELKDIYIYEFLDNRELKVATHAGSAVYQGDHWLLKDIRQSRFSEDAVVSTQLESASWESMLSPNLIDIVVRPTLLPIWGLYQYIEFMHENGQEARVYEVAFWGKVLTPLVTLVMVFLSVPIVFGVLRSVGVGQRIFVGALLGTLFLMMSKAFANMAVVYQLNPLFASSFPGLLLFAVGLWFARKQH